MFARFFSHFKFSSTITTRYLADSIGCNFFLHNFRFSFDRLVFLLFLKRIASIFVAFKAILFAFSQKESSFKSLRILFNTAYYWTALQIHSGSDQKGKDVLKFRKFQKNLNCLSFSDASALQSRISDLRKYRLQEKCFLLSVLKYFKISQKKVYNEVISLTRHFIKITS